MFVISPYLVVIGGVNDIRRFTTSCWVIFHIRDMLVAKLCNFVGDRKQQNSFKINNQKYFGHIQIKLSGNTVGRFFNFCF